MERLPNLFIAGYCFSGKTELTNALKEQYGYSAINTGSFILDKLLEERGNSGGLTHTDIHAFRDELIAQNGPLYFLPQNNTLRPQVIDGIRSYEVAEALIGLDYRPVIIGASLTERVRRATKEERMSHRAKPNIGTHELLLALDAEHRDTLNAIAELATTCFINDGQKPVRHLADTIVMHLQETQDLRDISA